MAKFINITVNNHKARAHFIINFNQNSSVVLVYPTVFNLIIIIYHNLMCIRMMVIQEDETGIISHTLHKIALLMLPFD